MKDIKLIHALIGLLVLVSVTTAGTVLWFTPKTYAEDTREMVVMMSESQQLKWLMGEKREFELVCTDKITDEWVCSESKKERYDGLLLDIQMLRLKLGLPIEEVP